MKNGFKSNISFVIMLGSILTLDQKNICSALFFFFCYKKHKPIIHTLNMVLLQIMNIAKLINLCYKTVNKFTSSIKLHRMPICTHSVVVPVVYYRHSKTPSSHVPERTRGVEWNIMMFREGMRMEIGNALVSKLNFFKRVPGIKAKLFAR